MKYIFFIFLLIPVVHASCPGMKGEMLKRCQCFEKLERPTLEEQKCQQPDDCAVLHDKCGGWSAFNRKYEAKYKELYKSPHFKSQMPEPNVTCHQNMCRLRPKVPMGRGRS